MNVQLLIDAIVRQTTVLLAQLATSGGLRAPLAHIASQVFLDLSTELEQQGISKKVSSDMFGMVLRAYRRKLARLREGSGERTRSLWQAILDFLADGRLATRQEISDRFARGDDGTVRAVLRDLCESGLVFATGSGDKTVYRQAEPAELEAMRQIDQGAGLEDLLWVIIYRQGPLEAQELVNGRYGDPALVNAALDLLKKTQRVQEEVRDGRKVLVAREFLVPLGAAHGWEAAVLDHYEAMVQTRANLSSSATRRTQAN